MTLKFTILGCGSSGGVPRPALGWGVCDPNNPKNRRRRTSLLVERRNGVGVSRVLVDTSPDLRDQLLDAEVERVDAVIWTHEHADQAHGIDDLRPYVLRQGPIDSWADRRTHEILLQRFSYCFEAEGNGFYNPIYRHHEIVGPFSAAGLPVVPFAQDHGTVPSVGLRFGRVTYANDVVTLSDEAFDVMAGTEVLIVDAMRFRPHPTHAHLDRALEWIERLRPKRAFLTNLHVDMDYAELDRLTPAHVQPCHDGLAIEVDGE